MTTDLSWNGWVFLLSFFVLAEAAALVLLVLRCRKWKRLAAANAENSTFYRAVLDDLPGYVFIKDADDNFRYLYMNRNCEQLPVQEATGNLDDDILFAGEAADIRALDAEVIRSGRESIDFRVMRTRDGRKIEMKIWKRLLIRNGSRLLIGISSDITCERELKRQLAEQFRELDASLQDEQSINRCLSLLATTDDFDSCAQFILEELGNRSGADRSVAYLFDRERREVKRAHEWRRENLPVWPSRVEVFGGEKFDYFRRELQERREIVVGGAMPPPAGLEFLAERLLRLGVHSIMIAGIWLKNELTGVICLYHMDEAHPFVGADRHRLRNACNLYALLMERELRLQEIQESSSLKEQIFANIAMPVVMFDLNYNIVMVNPTACDALKRPEAEVVGRKCYEMLCDCAAPPQWCPLKRVAEEKQAVSIDFAGHGRQYLVTVQPVFGRDGRMIYGLETAVDIFEQWRQKQELTIKNLQLNRVAELARITYFIGDGELEVRIIGGNRDIGFSGFEEAPVNLLLWTIPEDRPELQRQRDLIVSGRQDYAELVCRSDSSGMRRTFRLLVARDCDSGCHFGFIQDITADIALENEHKELIRSLEGYVENERVMNSCLSQIMLEEDFDRNVGSILRIIAAQLGGDRAWLGTFDEFGRKFAITHEWFDQAFSALLGQVDSGLTAQFLQWYGRFQCDGLLMVSDTEDREFGDRLRSIGCRTLIGAPIWLGNELYGILCIGFRREGRAFSAQEKNILRSTAQILALAQTRQRQCETVRTLHLQSQLIINAIPIPVLLFSADGQLLCCNPAAGDLCGRSVETMQRMPCFKNLCCCEKVPDYCPVWNAIRSGKPCSSRLSLHQRECLMAATPVRGRNGEITHVLETVIDLTEIHEGRRKLEEAVRAADTANTAKSSFLAAISHEMRTPLSSVIGFSELLRNDQLPRAEQLEYIESIHLAGNVLLAQINDVIDLSKLEAGQLEIVPQWLDLAALLREVEAAVRRVFQAKELEFVLDFPPDLPQMQLDGRRLRQILLKLLGNAVKSMKPGKVTLEVRFRPGSDRHGDLFIRLQDTFAGIPAEELEKIFQPYNSRLDAARNSSTLFAFELGLPICRKLLNLMGGSIRAESEAGRGGRFIVELPGLPYRSAAAASLPAVPAAQPVDDRLPAADSEPQLRILVVDDVPMNLKVLSAILRKLKARPIVAQSGSEALELLKKIQADLVLTDLWMPGMNGDELAAAIHRLDGMANMTIYAVTADMEARSHFDGKDFHDILLKPITLDGLQKLLERVRRSDDPPHGSSSDRVAVVAG